MVGKLNIAQAVASYGEMAWAADLIGTLANAGSNRTKSKATHKQNRRKILKRNLKNK